MRLTVRIGAQPCPQGAGGRDAQQLAHPYGTAERGVVVRPGQRGGRQLGPDRAGQDVRTPWQQLGPVLGGVPAQGVNVQKMPQFPRTKPRSRIVPTGSGSTGPIGTGLDVAEVQLGRPPPLLVARHADDRPVLLGERRQDLARRLQQLVVRRTGEQAHEVAGPGGGPGEVGGRHVVAETLTDDPLAHSRIGRLRQVFHQVDPPPPAYLPGQGPQVGGRVPVGVAQGDHREQGELVVPPERHELVAMVLGVEQPQQRDPQLDGLALVRVGGQRVPELVDRVVVQVGGADVRQQSVHQRDDPGLPDRLAHGGGLERVDRHGQPPQLLLVGPPVPVVDQHAVPRARHPHRLRAAALIEQFRSTVTQLPVDGRTGLPPLSCHAHYFLPDRGLSPGYNEDLDSTAGRRRRDVRILRGAMLRSPSMFRVCPANHGRPHPLTDVRVKRTGGYPAACR